MRSTNISKKNPIVFVGMVISVCCILVIMISVAKLPEASWGSEVVGPYRTATKNRKLNRKGEWMGKLGEMMVEMLPEDLAFTIFIPSEKAFERDTRLRAEDSLAADQRNDTYAVVSRILGFSAVPRSILSSMIPAGEGVSFDSLSGFTLYMAKDGEGVVVVNNRVRAEEVDLRRGEIVVHIVDGVIMDAEFEQAVRPFHSYGDTD